jgi:hypothetical protein
MATKKAAAKPRARRAKGKVHRLPADVRTYIGELLRADRHTLDEMLDAIRARFPAAEVSRSGLHRYAAGEQQLFERMQAINKAADALIGGLGEGAGEKAGTLLAHAITATVTHAALRAQENDETSLADINKLALAANRALQGRKIATQERIQLRNEARAQLLREQSERLDETVRAQGMNEEQANFWRQKVLGIQ